MGKKRFSLLGAVVFVVGGAALQASQSGDPHPLQTGIATVRDEGLTATANVAAAGPAARQALAPLGETLSGVLPGTVASTAPALPDAPSAPTVTPTTGVQ